MKKHKLKRSIRHFFRRRATHVFCVTLALCLVVAGFVYMGTAVYVRSSEVALGVDVPILKTSCEDARLEVSLFGKNASLDLTELQSADAAAANRFYLIPAPIRLAVPVVGFISDWLMEYAPF